MSNILLDKLASKTEHALRLHLPGDESTLSEAMRYATLGGGKRLRGALIYACATDFDVNWSKLDTAAAAIECIHAYSLIHDDLPVMDDDDLRRGRPSTHKAYGEATAILAGDALNTLAFEILSRGLLPAEIRINQISLLSKACGYHGMIAGQMLDMAHTGAPCDLATLKIIHARKTGDLIRAALHLSGMAAGMDIYEQHRSALDATGKAIGLAYQIADDVLDATRSSDDLGKTAGKDDAQHKSTFPALLGVDASIAEAERLFEQALTSCASLPNQGEQITTLIDAIAQREH